MRKDKLDCFKLCFRVKVTDAISYEKIKVKAQEFMMLEENQGKNYKESKEYEKELKKLKDEIAKSRTFIISFIKSSQEVYDSIKDGQRIRFYNLKPDGTVSMQGSQIKNE